MQKHEVPFFARLLEAQEELCVRTDVKAGAHPPQQDVTLKYPSDSDEELIVIPTA